MKQYILNAIWFALATVLCGCASVGHSFNSKAAEQLDFGSVQASNYRSVFGEKPTATEQRSTPDGKFDIVRYSYAFADLGTAKVRALVLEFKEDKLNAFIYDGKLVIQERDINNLPTTTYTRGKDLSGSLEGAGGIGGLLARTAQSYVDAPLAGHAFYHADGNGNIIMLINSEQVIVANYLYDAFGNAISASGLLANANLYRFSSKEAHLNSGLAYYLYRYYDPNLQRWLNRDPIEESGGINLYRYAVDDPVDFFDSFGLTCASDCANQLANCYNTGSIIDATLGGFDTGGALQTANKTCLKPRGGVAGGGESGPWTSWTRTLLGDAGKGIGRISIIGAAGVGAGIGLLALHAKCLSQYAGCLAGCPPPPKPPSAPLTCPPPSNCNANAPPTSVSP